MAPTLWDPGVVFPDSVYSVEDDDPVQQLPEKICVLVLREAQLQLHCEGVAFCMTASPFKGAHMRFAAAL